MVKCSVLTDVYSFGVLTFEVFSFAGFPFDALTDKALLGLLTAPDEPPLHTLLTTQLDGTLRKHGHHGPAGQHAHAFAASLIRACLARTPVDRPSFAELGRMTSRKEASKQLVRHRSGISRQANKHKQSVYDGFGGADVATDADADAIDPGPSNAGTESSSTERVRHQPVATQAPSVDDGGGGGGGAVDSGGGGGGANVLVGEDRSAAFTGGPQPAGPNLGKRERGGTHNVSVYSGFDEPTNEETML